MATITLTSTSMATPSSTVSTPTKTVTDCQTGGIRTRATTASSMWTTSRWAGPSTMGPAVPLWFGRLYRVQWPSTPAVWHTPGCMDTPCKALPGLNRPSIPRLTVLGRTTSSTKAHTTAVTRRASGPAPRTASGSTSSEIRMSAPAQLSPTTKSRTTVTCGWPTLA